MLIGIAFESKIPKKCSFIDKLKIKGIQKWTNSKYFHTEFIIGNYWVAATTDGIIRYDLRPLTSQYDYIFIDLKMSEPHYNKIIHFIDSQLGTKYDWMGIFFSQFVTVGSNHEDKWFCSELVTKLLQLCLVENVFDMQPHLVSPGDLFRRLQELVFDHSAFFANGKTGQEKLEKVFGGRPSIYGIIAE